MYMHMQIKQYMLIPWGELMNFFDLWFKWLQAYSIIVKQQSINNHFHWIKMS